MATSNEWTLSNNLGTRTGRDIGPLLEWHASTGARDLYVERDGEPVRLSPEGMAGTVAEQVDYVRRVTLPYELEYLMGSWAQLGIYRLLEPFFLMPPAPGSTGPDIGPLKDACHVAGRTWGDLQRAIGRCAYRLSGNDDALHDAFRTAMVALVRIVGSQTPNAPAVSENPARSLVKNVTMYAKWLDWDALSVRQDVFEAEVPAEWEEGGPLHGAILAQGASPSRKDSWASFTDPANNGVWASTEGTLAERWAFIVPAMREEVLDNVEDVLGDHGCSVRGLRANTDDECPKTWGNAVLEAQAALETAAQYQALLSHLV
jgi:hypothetical protein